MRKPGLSRDDLQMMQRVVERNARGREAPMVITPLAVARLIKADFQRHPTDVSQGAEK
jgi:hypothetical protein